jgi:hypothetical protein
MRRTLLLASLFAWAATARAQHTATAIRLILYEAQKVYADQGIGTYCVGLGVDRTLNDRLTLGLDVALDLVGRMQHTYTSVSYDPVTNASMEVKPRLLSLNYHTEYALGDNSGTHPYIGSFVGLRMLKQEWRITEQGPMGSDTRLLDLSKTLVPVGIRMGLRGTTEGGFLDLYAALGYQIGGGGKLDDNLPVDNVEYVNTSALAFTLGLAYGTGW